VIGITNKGFIPCASAYFLRDQASVRAVLAKLFLERKCTRLVAGEHYEKSIKREKIPE